LAVAGASSELDKPNNTDNNNFQDLGSKELQEKRKQYMAEFAEREKRLNEKALQLKTWEEELTAREQAIHETQVQLEHARQQIAEQFSKLNEEHRQASTVAAKELQQQKETLYSRVEGILLDLASQLNDE
jgi:chromosome segregation ATPase